MKKFLLSTALLLAGFGFASADEVTLKVADATNKVGTEKEDGTAIQPLESFEINGYAFTFKAGADAQASQMPAYWNADNTCRIYIGAEMSISAPEGTTFKSIVWNCKSIKGVSANNSITATEGGSFAYDATAKTITWSIDEAVNSVNFVIPSTKDGSTNPNIQILSFKISSESTEVGGGEDPVDPPVVEPTAVSDVAGLKALADQTEFVFTGAAYVSQCTGKYLFVQDATGAALLFGTEWTYKYGDCLTSFKGKRSDYNSVAEFQYITDVVLGEPAEVTPKVIANATEAVANVDWYVKIDDASISEDGKTLTFADNSTLPMYNRFNIEAPAGEYPEVYGVIGQYGTTVQFYFIGSKALSLNDEPIDPPVVDPVEGLLEVKNATNIVGEDGEKAYQPLESFEIDGYKFEFKAGEEASASQQPAWWKADSTCRIYLANEMTVTAPEGKAFEGLLWNCKSIKGVSEENAIVADKDGSFTYEAKSIEWRGASAISTVTFTLPATPITGEDGKNVNPNIQIESFQVLGEGATGVAGIASENGVKMVYDLNGRVVRNNNLDKGIYIVKEGSKTYKVIVK